MGSPLAPVLANLFMGHHEQHWLIQKEALSVLFYKRYVDDIFCIFKTSEQADKFLDFLNTRHKNIKFTIEKEQDQKLPFLDVLITKKSNNRITTNYRKSTETGLLTKYLSFILTRYKLRLVKAYVDRLYKINNTWSGFHNDTEKTKSILQKNLFPPNLIDKIVRNYLSDQYNSKESLNKKVGRYFKLPYVGFFSSHTHNRIKGIIKKLCKDQVSVNLVFVPYKIGSMFSKKDKIPSFLKSMVVYINLFVQAVMLVTWVKLPVIYLPE